MCDIFVFFLVMLIDNVGFDARTFVTRLYSNESAQLQ